ncbi:MULTISPECIES: DUF413 domain-containing protein [Thalassotalea]|uniref:Macrodomain Ori protein n=1 Tax=Thalassotalea castellviae TaxID=3075612 RepID=A0ABU3A5W1_9GAMM|nr:DUF413 domain-containing protein [Thalassotalea sp. W431]MDT0605225.1 DUF413 domain-containing protein [Thalassotalea sp. W431]
MTTIHGFIQTDRFYDDVHFPRGFSKSGDFTIADAELLSVIGKRLLMLEQGEVLPENQVEEKFVFSCKSGNEGETKIEILWQKYKKLTQYKPFHSLHRCA